MSHNPETRPNSYKLVLIASMPRSGSMWAFNIARLLLEKTGKMIKPDSIPASSEDQQRALTSAFENRNLEEIHCIKTHFQINFAEQVLPDLRIITPYRDLRDALLSYNRFVGVDFDQGLSAVAKMISVTNHYLSMTDEIVFGFMYEEMILDPRKTIGEIADFLGILASEEEISSIDDMFSRKSVKTLIDNISGKIVDKSPDGRIRKMDSKTGFQSRHIAENQDEKWSAVFSEVEKEKLHSLTHDWLVQRGYSTA